MSVYLQAFIVWAIFSFGTKLIFLKSIVTQNILLAYVPVSIATALYGVAFLYFLRHKDIFKFAEIIERKEKKAKKKWIRHLIEMGKVIALTLSALISGPLLTSILGKVLLRKRKYAYAVVFSVCFLATIIWLAVARGTVSFIKIIK